MGLSSFNSKWFCYSYEWSCSLSEGGDSICLWLIPRKLWRLFFLRFQLALLQSAPYLFSALNHCAIFVCIVFGVISTNINRLLSVNSSAKVFFFGDISVYHKDQLSYSGGTNRPDEYCHNLKRPYSDSGLSYVILECNLILTVWLIWSCLFLLTLVFVLECLPFHWEILKCCCLSSHWLPFKLEELHFFLSHSFCWLSCWLGCPSWSIKRFSIEGYI